MRDDGKEWEKVNKNIKWEPEEETNEEVRNRWMKETEEFYKGVAIQNAETTKEAGCFAASGHLQMLILL